jgi:hypothetical protein
MEKKLGSRRGKIFGKTALATKMLMIFGLTGLFVSLGGYTCQTINNQTVMDNLKQQMNDQLLTTKAQLKQEMEDQIKNVENKIMNEYTERDFAEFTIKYPLQWKITRGDDNVLFDPITDNGKGESFMISSYDKTLATKLELKEAEWNGKKVMRNDNYHCEGDGSCRHLLEIKLAVNKYLLVQWYTEKGEKMLEGLEIVQ